MTGACEVRGAKGERQVKGQRGFNYVTPDTLASVCCRHRDMT